MHTFKMHNLYLIGMLYFIQKYVSAQTNTIVFTETVTSTNQPASTKSSMMCNCVPLGTCQDSNNNGIDIRIVNTGANCVAGYTYCCTSGNIIDATCGTRKISVVPEPTGVAGYGAYPWQAALLTTNNDYIGSGVLISPNHVLTVAHKVTPYTAGGLKIRLGEWDGQSISEPYPYQEYMAQRIFIHNNFSSQNLQNDVAVIRLSASVPLSNSPAINTACLPSAIPAAQTRCWVSGWGKNAFGPSGSYQSILKEVDVPIVASDACETALRGTRLGQFFILNRNSFLCAGGEPGKDACTGDGGAPLVCQSSSGQWQITGMVTWGIGCATGGVPGIYVNVLNFVPWINQKMNEI